MNTVDSFKITPHRAKILSVLRQGAIEDPSGRASPILRVQTGHRTHNALAAILHEMEQAGLLTRDVNGRRTYRIALTSVGRQLADTVKATEEVSSIADNGGLERLREENAMLRSMIDILLDKLAKSAA